MSGQRYVFLSATGPRNIVAADIHDAAELAAGHPHVQLVKVLDGSWAVEERVRRNDGTFARRIIGRLVRGEIASA